MGLLVPPRTLFTVLCRPVSETRGLWLCNLNLPHAGLTSKIKKLLYDVFRQKNSRPNPPHAPTNGRFRASSRASTHLDTPSLNSQETCQMCVFFSSDFLVVHVNLFQRCTVWPEKEKGIMMLNNSSSNLNHFYRWVHSLL